jgi:DNA invertase Pin-like site-specific DNA recombinase
MSKEDQQYSIANQSSRIREYAQHLGFEVIKTYEDPGQSGVLLKHRKGLKELLKDVVTGVAQFKVILVYDVSRWGRFQNPDEAAHYEFICASSGIPLHYCAEQFVNDGTASSAVVKALKRSMAAEFSRELGDKVFRGKTRLAEMGFWMGGPAPYGYRRRIISADGTLRQVLEEGEEKSLKTDRVKLVLGPRREVNTVRLLFDMAAEGINCTHIARTLNRRNMSRDGKRWSSVTVLLSLTNPAYIGSNVWYRRTQRLRTPQKSVESQFWTEKPSAFPPIVDQDLFDAAQATIEKMRESHWSPEKVLAKIKRVLKRKGKLSEQIVLHSRGTPSPGTIRKYFGTFADLYKALNYQTEDHQAFRLVCARRSTNLRKRLAEQLKTLFPQNVEILLTWRGARPTLRVDNTVMVAIAFCHNYKSVRRLAKYRNSKRAVRTLPQYSFWEARPLSSECGYITLLCFVNKECDDILDFYVVDGINDQVSLRLRRNDRLLRRAIKLNGLQDFYDAVMSVWQQRLKKEPARQEACDQSARMSTRDIFMI